MMTHNRRIRAWVGTLARSLMFWITAHGLSECRVDAQTAAAEKLIPSSPPLAPDESARRFTVADGLELELLLAEPQIAQPLHISFDARGRLWLVEFRQYPAPAGLTLVSHDQFWRAVYDKVPEAPPRHFPGKDRISIHEDTDGDGRLDRHSVFVDGLNIATSVAHGRGGVWVLNPPYLLFYPDRDGNDVPDGDPEVHLEGFGLEDTHSMANSLRWGPDGWLYAAQGSTVSGRIRRPGSKDAPVMTLGQNIWRYHPERRKYEVFSEGGGNAFGVEIDDEGRVFSGHNGGNTRGFHYVQGGYLQKGFEKHGQLSNPHAYGYFPQMPHNAVERFTHTFVVYGGGAFSAEFDGRLFGVEPLQGRVVMSERTPEGSTFRTRDLGYAVVSQDPWFKPVDIKLGPDGALYIADWYDFQVNHWRNYQGNMDAGNGRVYRLKSSKTPRRTVEDLGRVPPARWVDLLSNENRWVRETVRRLMADRRDPALVAPLASAVRGGKGLAALEALWALHAVGGFTPETALATLEHETPVVREWAVRLAGDGEHVPERVVEKLEGMAVTEPHLAVRQQIAATARRLPGVSAIRVVQGLLQRDEDAKDLRQPLMLWWAVEAVSIRHRPEVMRMFDNAALWDHPLVADHLLERLIGRYGSESGPEDFASCLTLIRRAPGAKQREALVAGFERAFEGRTLGGVPGALVTALAESGAGSMALQMKARRPGSVERGLSLMADEKGAVSGPIQVAQVLGELKVESAIPVLLEASGSTQEPVRLAALGALGGFDAPEIPARVLREMGKMTSSTRAAAYSLLASRPAWALEFARAVSRKELGAELVPSEIVRHLRRYQGAELKGLVENLWPMPGRASTTEMESTIRRIADVVRSGTGDPYAGKRLFATQCGACHRLFHVGGAIGPDLTPYRRNDLDSLLLNIVNPSAEIREGYENQLIETRDDRSLSGFIVRQDDRLLVLRGLDGQDVVLERQTITEQRAAGLSLMPEGLMESWNDQQLRDFFAYLRSSQPLPN